MHACRESIESNDYERNNRYATIRSRRLGLGQLGTGRLGTADVMQISKRL